MNEVDSKFQAQYQKALDYHKNGKLKVEPRSPLKSQEDLSLAYSPGVAIPCKEIHQDILKAYDYTSKSHLVAVISNGTAVLGLGDIGAIASKPVMEGKAILFKTFGDIDAFDIEINETDVDAFVAVVKAISPTFGGINLEDIKAPECFEIERRLVEELDIPVMHDDQHGTAIASSAAIINASFIISKPIESMRVVISGAGAAAIACAKMYKELGVKEIIMFDSRGVIYSGRSDLEGLKKEFAVQKHYVSYEEALKGADVFLGLSKADLLKAEDIMGMNENPLIFAMSNPIPEILPEVVHTARPDAIMATGRSDYPNQINNVLGFPYIFKGALEVRAKKINEAMKFAAAYAIAYLAREPVEEELKKIHDRDLSFGKEYLIPSPFDSRLKEKVSRAVAQAAIESGMAQL
ncbi:malic enzyme-like NAD(P)-binding protein [Helicobacter sp. 13S00477-4]|uniref:malic enzyme-like NAD(P)-binding protein n=1 Tax=Helicobacter sp. 13S00477-4 TaxID=1905759 RepID=UPI000BA5FFEC|nr:malic enzyme-like NAD(P)-binding protein [Helicobacter sp. 13S00477-4]PAF52174.1 malate dehydrogenase [Helicobacter sp. 13S00477-4]